MLKKTDDKLLQVIELTVHTLAELKNISIDSETIEQVRLRVLDTVEPPEQYAPASIEGIVDCIKKLGGFATRAEITSNTGMNPNSISSLLNKLVKKNVVYKIPLEHSSSNRKGRGHIAEYGYQLAEMNGD